MSDRGPLIDLSHPIADGLVTYPGLPEPVIRPHLTRAASRRCTPRAPSSRSTRSPWSATPARTSTARSTATPTATTSPDSRSSASSACPPSSSHLTDAPHRGITADDLAGLPVRGCAVLLHTGWDRHFGTPAYGVGAPFLTEDATAYLVDQGAVLVGIDSVNIDDTESGGARPAHTLLLGAGILVVEHLTALDRLPTLGCRFTAAPPRVRGFGTFPVRAFAELPVAPARPAARPACAPRTRRSAPVGRARRACAPGRDRQDRS